MAIANLHSLLNKPWYIHQGYAEAHLPLLFNILNGMNPPRKLKGATEADYALMGAHGASYGLQEQPSEKVVAVLNIKSPIYKYSQECGPRGTRDYMAIMENLELNQEVSGVVLDIDSGGGQVYGTPEFHDFLRSYSKPVVTYTDGLLASAAFYIAAGTDHIVANKRAEAIGSIGAYAQFLNLEGYYEKMGAKLITVYADQSSEKNKAYRELMDGKPEAYIKEDLNPIVDNFIADMKAARPGISEDVFKGATYSGPVALEKGLVDSLGTLQDAVAKIFELEKSNSNKSQTNMSKPQSFPNLELVLGLSEPLAETDNGSYLNQEHKSTLENALAANATALENAQAAQAQAETALQTANDAHAAALTAATEPSVAAVAALRNAATLAGVEGLAEDATADQIAGALNARIEEMNAKPGATHTTGADNSENAVAGQFAIDKSNSIYSHLTQ